LTLLNIFLKIFLCKEIDFNKDGIKKRTLQDSEALSSILKYGIEKEKSS